MFVRTSDGKYINTDYIVKIEDEEFPFMRVIVTMSNGDKFKLYYPSTAKSLARLIETGSWKGVY